MALGSSVEVAWQSPDSLPSRRAQSLFDLVIFFFFLNVNMIRKVNSSLERSTKTGDLGCLNKQNSSHKRGQTLLADFSLKNYQYYFRL